jgi:hypothetical protein
VTGGSWLIVGKNVKVKKLFGKKTYRFIYFYELKFFKREPNAKLERITKIYSSWAVQHPKDIRQSEDIWEQVQQDDSPLSSAQKEKV